MNAGKDAGLTSTITSTKLKLNQAAKQPASLMMISYFFIWSAFIRSVDGVESYYRFS
jgi:hypothetical protein